MHNPVGWFEIYVQDMQRAQHFYEGVFQLQLSPLPNIDMEMLVFPMADDGRGISGALVNMPGVPSGGNSTLVYFSCDDCGIEEARVKEFGGNIFKPRMSIGEYGFISLVLDTEGNMIGLHSLR